MYRPFEREIAAALAVGCKQDANIYLVNFVVFLGGAFWRLSGFDHLCVILANKVRQSRARLDAISQIVLREPLESF